MKYILKKLCAYLEKKLYDELTWEELSKALNRTKYQLSEAQEEIKRLKRLFLLKPQR